MSKKSWLVVLAFFLALGSGPSAGFAGTASVDLGAPMEKLGEVLTWNLNPTYCLGTPVTVGDLTLIPVTSKAFGFGLGGGNLLQGEARNQDKMSREENKDRAGMGAGGGGCVRTIAIIVIKKDGSFQIHRLNESFVAQVIKTIIPVAHDLIEKVFEMKKMKLQKTDNPVSRETSPQR